MGETTHQIEAHIENTRAELGSNLQELEQKVKSATDWKQYFRSKPMAMLGVAFGAGVVLAAMTGSRRRTAREFISRAGRSKANCYASEAMDTVGGALAGVAAKKVKDLVGQTVS